MINQKVIWVVCWLAYLTACQQVPVKTETLKMEVFNLAEQFVNAYNAHDQELMLSLVHPEIKYMYIDGNQIYTETNSKNALGDFLVNFFQHTPEAKSKLLSSHEKGTFIHQVEQALWQNESGQHKSQCSLSVYEIKKQLIINIWYFTAFKCP